jgi:ABC-type multidrug transport system permease subunit
MVQFKEFFRETGAIFWALLFPIIMSWVLGVAFMSKGNIERAVAVVESGSEESVAFRKSLSEKTGGKLFFTTEYAGTVRFEFMKAADAVLALKRGKITLFIEHGSGGPVFRLDPQNPEALLLQKVTAGFLEGEDNSDGSISPLTASGTRYIDFLLPGLIAMQIMSSCMWGIGWALIEWRIKKLMRRMYATPMNRPVFMASYFLTRLVLSTIESMSLFIFGYFVFGVRLQGSPAAFALLLLAGNIAFTGIALLISSRTSNSRTGNGLLNAVNLPMMILSGIFFSYHNFPEWSQGFISALPLTMLADSMRAVFIEGAGLAQVMTPAGIMILFGLICSTAALKIYRWY